MNHQTRESWLADAIERLKPWLSDVGHPINQHIHVSTGFPSKMALSAKKQRIGECWNGRVSKDGNPHIFISPVLDDATRVLDVLVHELGHAAVGTEHGHKGPFKAFMKATGLEGKPTATVASVELTNRLNVLLGRLGPYPHPTFSVSALKDELDKKKQSTRLLKAFCPTDKAEDKPYTVRITKIHLDTFGPPICPECLKRMNVEGWEPDSEEGE